MRHGVAHRKLNRTSTHRRAMFANMVALPIADKLNLRKSEEGLIKAICIDGVLAIQEGQNPRIIEAMLKAYLEPKKRKEEPSESAAAEAA